MSNNQIVFYDKVWNVNKNLALAITMADVGSHSPNTRNGYISLVNVQNASNTELRYTPFEVGETIYANDSNLTFTFTALDQVVYLDAPLTANGTYNNSGYGFQTGDIITQFCPQESVDVVLTEEEYLNLCGCSRCGCSSSDCACEGGPTISNRTVTVVTSPERTITATVMYENLDPPWLMVKDATEPFCRYPITNGTITANVVGALSPLAKGNVYNGNYIIERPALYARNFAFPDYVVYDPNLGLYLGPHIGIDKHFNNKRSQDYNNDYIIISNWDITGNNVPIGRVLDLYDNPSRVYNSISMSVNVSAYNVRNKLFDLKSTGNSNASFSVYANGTTVLNSYTSNAVFKIQNNYTTGNIVLIATNNYINIENPIQGNKFLTTNSYSEPYFSNIINGTLTFDLNKGSFFYYDCGNNPITSINFIKPTYYVANSIQSLCHSCTVMLLNVPRIDDNVWENANVLWPAGGLKPNANGSIVIFSFMNYDDKYNTTITDDDLSLKNTWFGFEPLLKFSANNANGNVSYLSANQLPRVPTSIGGTTVFGSPITGLFGTRKQLLIEAYWKNNDDFDLIVVPKKDRYSALNYFWHAMPTKAYAGSLWSSTTKSETFTANSYYTKGFNGQNTLIQSTDISPTFESFGLVRMNVVNGGTYEYPADNLPGYKITGSNNFIQTRFAIPNVYNDGTYDLWKYDSYSYYGTDDYGGSDGRNPSDLGNNGEWAVINIVFQYLSTSGANNIYRANSVNIIRPGDPFAQNSTLFFSRDVPSRNTSYIDFSELVVRPASAANNIIPFSNAMIKIFESGYPNSGITNDLLVLEPYIIYPNSAGRYTATYNYLHGLVGNDRATFDIIIGPGYSGPTTDGLTYYHINHSGDVRGTSNVERFLYTSSIYSESIFTDLYPGSETYPYSNNYVDLEIYGIHSRAGSTYNVPSTVNLHAQLITSTIDGYVRLNKTFIYGGSLVYLRHANNVVISPVDNIYNASYLKTLRYFSNNYIEFR